MDRGPGKWMATNSTGSSVSFSSVYCVGKARRLLAVSSDRAAITEGSPGGILLYWRRARPAGPSIDASTSASRFRPAPTCTRAATPLCRACSSHGRQRHVITPLVCLVWSIANEVYGDAEKWPRRPWRAWSRVAARRFASRSGSAGSRCSRAAWPRALASFSPRPVCFVWRINIEIYRYMGRRGSESDFQRRRLAPPCARPPPPCSRPPAAAWP